MRRLLKRRSSRGDRILREDQYPPGGSLQCDLVSCKNCRANRSLKNAAAEKTPYSIRKEIEIAVPITINCRITGQSNRKCASRR